jgi:hypothetical protein
MKVAFLGTFEYSDNASAPERSAAESKKVVDEAIALVGNNLVQAGAEDVNINGVDIDAELADQMIRPKSR